MDMARTEPKGLHVRIYEAMPMQPAEIEARDVREHRTSCEPTKGTDQR